MISRREFLPGAAASVMLMTRSRAEVAPDDEISAILKDRIDNARQGVGIVECSFGSAQQRIVTYGRSDGPNDRPLDGDTVFEIGSITKVFTALLLAEMATRGEVALDDPMATYLPDRVRMPSRSGRQITLIDLATYTSGLPRTTDGISDSGDNPYATYTVEQLYAFLSNYTLRFDPGTHYEYSNLAYGLLGHALALRADSSYEDLVVSRVCAPLELDDTRITLTASMRNRLAHGHLANLKPSSNWDLPTLAGAGALRSTAHDLTKFTRATCLTAPGTPLRQAIDLLPRTRRPTSTPDMSVGLGWFVLSGNNDEVIWKDGLTGGYASFVGFSTRLRSGVVVLSNSANPVDDIGWHLSNPAYQIARYPPEVAVDPAVLATYVGVYQLTPNFTITIRADSGRLFASGTGQNEFELFAESENRFFMRIVDAQGTFLRGKDGVVDRLLWHQGGKYRYCPRVP
jgi:serine-type D-Ala-D-Ala carboxypeptidase/endopeptidase